MTEHPLNPKANRERMTQHMFEKFNVQGLFISMPSVLSVYATGRLTGLAIDIGDSVTSVVPVNDCAPERQAIKAIDFGGRDLTERMQKLLADVGVTLTSPAEKEIVRVMKEQLCFVAQDYERECEQPDDAVAKTFELPDGTEVVLKQPRFACPEAIFNPTLDGREFTGLAGLVNSSIDKCDRELRGELVANVVVAGGSSLFPNFPQRLQGELQQLDAKIMAPPERKILAWLGGSTLASLSDFQSRWITKEQFEECGPEIVHQKCA